MMKLIAKSINKYFGKETKEEEVITVKPSRDWDPFRNAALERIHYRVNEGDFVALAELIPKFIRECGALSLDVEYTDHSGNLDALGSSCKSLYGREVFACKDPILMSFCVELCAGEKPDVADYKRRYDLQQSLRQACDDGDVLLFDQLLEEGADINYRYASDIKHRYDNLGSTTLWEIVQCRSKSPIYRYFLTRSECTGVQEFLEEVKKAKEKAKAEEDLIASRTAQQ